MSHKPELWRYKLRLQSINREIDALRAVRERVVGKMTGYFPNCQYKFSELSEEVQREVFKEWSEMISHDASGAEVDFETVVDLYEANGVLFTADGTRIN